MARLNGFDIHYEVHGQGPVAMALTNSWGFTAAGVRALLSPLEERLTMVYFDPRGMGESGPVVEESDMGLAAVRADFQALREHLGLESVNAIGWSNGAMNLILLAAENPGTIETAIFVHGVASYTQEDYAEMGADYPELMQKYGQFLQDVQNPELTDAERTEMQRKLWLEEYFPVSTGDPENAPAMIDRLFADAEFNYRHAEYANRESPVFDARDRLAEITARCLVIAGAHDMIKPDAVQKLHEGLANSEFIVFESSGHFAPAEEPEAFKQAVFAFLGVS
jgi:proline iminopeptidase